MPFTAGSTSLANAGCEEPRKVRQAVDAAVRKVLRLTEDWDGVDCTDFWVDGGVE